jgi:xanthine dehydrogenase YagS FAD-binding subunit
LKPFDLVMPTSLDQALEALPSKPGAWSEARVLAGGQDLIPELVDYVTEADALVSLDALDELRGVQRVETALEIGALVRLAELEDDPPAGDELRALREAVAVVASPQIRSAATVGGNLCQRPRCWYYRNEETVCLKKGGTECFAYGGRNKYSAILGGGPSYIVHPSDLAPALVALDAEVTLVKGAKRARSERTVKLEDFYTLPADSDVTRETVLAPNEVLTRVRVPLRGSGWRSTYLKFRERSSFDFALSAVALALKVESGKIADARLVLGGVAPKPWRCHSAEKLLVGRAVDDETARAAGEEALAHAEPLAENGYKVPLTKGLIVKALRALRA